MTPLATYESICHKHGPFDLDPCATPRSAKCARYFTRLEDGLSQPWTPARVFMNPPFGREIGKWMKKAYEESLLGAYVVGLVPARTDTSWWHDYAMKGEIEFLRGRLMFERHDGSTGRAPFPSAVVVWRPR